MTNAARRLIALSILLLAACRDGVKPSGNVARPFTEANPFFSASKLPFQAPPFDKITNEDYQPALEAGMRDQIAEVHAIATDTAAPTFDNTIVAMEKTGVLLTRVANVFFAMTSANTNDTLQKVEEAVSPQLAAHGDAIHLNDTLFRRVKAVYDHRADRHLDSVQQFLVQRYYLDFVRAGAALADSDKAKLRQLNQEEATLSTKFKNHLLAGTKAAALAIADSAQLAGMSAAEVGSAAAAAQQRKSAAKWVLPLQNTTQQPLLASLTDRAVREKLFTASITRAEHGDSNDTRAIIQRLAQLRAQRAALLGYPSMAAYVVSDQMAHTPENAIKLLTDIVPAATAKASVEAADMQAMVRAEKGTFDIAPWDWEFYAEQVRTKRYALDESQLMPYFELDRVLKDGVFFAANQLYGLTFKERKDIPAYHPDVRVFEVIDADGKSIALWYCDYFKRDNKSGGAWENTFVDGSALLGNLPVATNVANFSKPAAGQPALLTSDDVRGMFHEFGHALHAMLTHVKYPRLTGTSVPTDFVEFPSQFNENWALEPTVLAHYAKHYQTGAPMPAELAAKIKRSATFDQGYAMTERVAAALLDMAWHTLPAKDSLKDVDAFEREALTRYKVDLAQVPPRYRSSYFLHIWSNGYYANYYAYLWSEVLDHDAYAWFTEHGGLTRANGQRFRDMVLSRGGTEDVAAMYRAWRGRDPSVQPLLVARGLAAGGKDK